MSAELVSVMLEEESLPPLRTSSMDSGLRAALTGEMIIAFKLFCIKLKAFSVPSMPSVTLLFVTNC